MIRRVALVLGAALLLVACSSTDSPPPRDPSRDSPTPSGPAAPTGPRVQTATATPHDRVAERATRRPRRRVNPTAVATANPDGALRRLQPASDEQTAWELVTGNAIWS